MLNFRYLHNNTYKHFKVSSVERVGVRTHSSDVQFVDWLGIIERNHAIELADKCIAVKLAIDSFSLETGKFDIKWEKIDNGQHMQGCYVPSLSGVFGVIEEGIPRLIENKYNMSGAHAGKYFSVQAD